MHWEVFGYLQKIDQGKIEILLIDTDVTFFSILVNKEFQLIVDEHRWNPLVLIYTIVP